MNRNRIITEEQTALEDFFGERVAVPDLPRWITDETIQYWREGIFHLHFLPKLALQEDRAWARWRDRPSKTFYKKIRGGQLPSGADTLPGKWMLLDARNKPEKKTLWVTSRDMWLAKKMGFHPQRYFRVWDSQTHEQEYLLLELARKGFGSRFCLSQRDIESMKPRIAEFLRLPPGACVQLPRFIEYNYLGNAFYPQWATTKTWEWFRDAMGDGQRLAGGSGSVGCIGWEPPDFWSTILTFRPVVELASHEPCD